MKVTGIESTPNPSSFKFTLDQCLGNQAGSTWSASTEGAPELLRPVLDLTDVESVYALSDWLCINKKPSAKWDAIVSFVPAELDKLTVPLVQLSTTLFVEEVPSPELPIFLITRT